MKEKKKFKDTKVGKFITEKAPGILDAVDDVFPPAKILTALVGNEKLSPEETTEFNKLLLEYEQTERKDFLADVANARNMQLEALKQDDVFSKRYIYYLASFIVATAVGFGGMLFFVQFPEENRRMIEMFADLFLFAGAVTVINYFFGSSKGSADKTKILGK